jgi:hypothetical protein
MAVSSVERLYRSPPDRFSLSWHRQVLDAATPLLAHRLGIELHQINTPRVDLVGKYSTLPDVKAQFRVPNLGFTVLYWFKPVKCAQ